MASVKSHRSWEFNFCSTMTQEKVSPGKLSNMFFSAKVLTNFTHQKLFLSLARQVDISSLGTAKMLELSSRRYEYVRWKSWVRRQRESSITESQLFSSSNIFCKATSFVRRLFYLTQKQLHLQIEKNSVWKFESKAKGNIQWRNLMIVYEAVLNKFRGRPNSFLVYFPKRGVNVRAGAIRATN